MVKRKKKSKLLRIKRKVGKRKQLTLSERRFMRKRLTGR